MTPQKDEALEALFAKADTPHIPTREDVQRLLHNFSHHAPDADKIVRHETLRHAAKGMAITLLEQCPPSRERSLAMTKLEEALMWANAAIAREVETQE